MSADPDSSYPSAGDRSGAAETEVVHDRLLAWFSTYGRDLPWRHTRDPYAVLVSEMMLQQTGVERVLPKYAAWLERFPTLQALAGAPRSEVIRLWAGLGYNSRAVRLQDIARQAVARYGGVLPERREELLALKGIGPYTAGAVLCFAYEQDVAFVDTNVRRVLSRVFLGLDDGEHASSEGRIQELAERVLPRGQAWAWHQALMDLGATICTDGKPSCLICPLQDVCRSAFAAGRFAREARAGYAAKRPKEGPWRGSTRYYRGRIVDALRSLPPGQRLSLSVLIEQLKPEESGYDAAWLRAQVMRLGADGLVAVYDGADGSMELSLPE